MRWAHEHLKDFDGPNQGDLMFCHSGEGVSVNQHVCDKLRER